MYRRWQAAIGGTALAVAGLWITAASAPAAAGDLDTSFSGNGSAVRDLSRQGKQDWASDVAVQEDGRIVTAGGARRAGRGLPVTVARFRANGKLQRGFGHRGIRYIDLPGASVRDMALDGFGRIYLLAARIEANGGPVLVRLHRGGRLDRRFARNGIKRLRYVRRARGFDPYALDLTPKGKPVVTGAWVPGAAGRPGCRNCEAALVARLKRGGRRDTGFSGNGWLRTRLEARRASGVAVEVGPRGRIVLAVQAPHVSPPGLALARFLPSGKLDPSFGAGGTTNSLADGGNLVAGLLRDLRVRDIKIDGQRTISLAGDGRGLDDPSYSGAFARVLPSGELDPTFSESGVRLVHAFNGFSSLDIQRDGRLVAMGSPSGRQRFAVARVLPSGELDGSFAGDGISVVKIGASSAGGRDLALAPTGEIVVAGAILPAWDTVLARFLAD